MRRRSVGLLLLLGCSGESEEDLTPTDEQEPAAPAADVQPLSTEIEADFPGQEAESGVEAQPVVLVLEFEGLGALHKSFFTDERVTSELQKRLLGHVNGAVGLVVSYDSGRGRGSIRIQAESDQFTRPLGGPEAVDLESAVPLTKTVAFYRDWVASNFDFRVQNFDVSLELTRGSNVCTFKPEGAPPPDGTQISPCFMAGSEEVCGTVADMVLSVPAAHRKAVGRCF